MSQAPQDMERSDEQPKSQYLSKKDFRIFAISLIVIGIILAPIYMVLKDRRDAYICKRNIKGIANAVSLYAADNNDRLPPVYMTADGVTPLVDKDGGVYSWAYLASQYMKKDVSFRCPKATDEECYMDHDYETGKLMPVSYGMYLPLGGMPISNVPNPDVTILIGETCSLGSGDTFDPHPLTDQNGKPVKDGFVIAWDTGNTYSPTQPNSVTRLALPDTSKGVFQKKGATRHPEGNHFLTVNGTALTLPPSAAVIQWDPKQKKVTGRWAIPDSFTLGGN